MSEGLEVGTLSGRIELEDALTNVLDKVSLRLDKFQEGWLEVGKTILKGAASFFTAEAALEAVKEAAHLAAETLKEITIEGSHAADVEDTFNRLTAQAGQLGDVLVDKVREGLRGTATDLDIMTRINQNLAVGLNLTGENLEVLSRGAFALAKATGGDAAGAMDKLSDAMVTGRVRGIQLLTGKINLADAEDKYAEKLNTTADHLTAEGKAAAIQAIILEKVESATARVGDQQTRLADKIQQAKVEFQNLLEEIGTAIATSPVLNAAYDGIRDALHAAFGSDQRELIHKIANMVDDLIITLVDAAPAVVEVGRIMGVTFIAGKNVVAGTLQVVDALGLGFLELAKGAKIAYAAISGNLDLEKLTEIGKLEAELARNIQERDKAMQDNVKDEEGWSARMDVLKVKLLQLSTNVHAAKEAGKDWDDVIRDQTNNQTRLTTVLDANGQTMELTKEELKKYKEAWENLNSIGSTWADTLEELDPRTKALVLDYAQLGAKVEDLKSAFPGLTKAQAEAAVTSVKAAKDVQSAYDDTFRIIAKMHGDNIKDWIEGERRKLAETLNLLQIKGKLTQEALDAELAKFDATVKAEIFSRNAQSAASKEFYVKERDEAKNHLDLLLADSVNHTAEEIRQARQLYTEKERALGIWSVHAQEAIAKEAEANQKKNDQELGYLMSSDAYWAKKNEEIKKQIAEVDRLNNAFRDLHQTMTGGAFDVTSQNFEQAIKSQQTSGGWNPSGAGSNIDLAQAYQWAKQGYSYAEILQMFTLMKNGATGAIPPPHGPRIPGFKDGGEGDFGDGSLVMLHGKEKITPVNTVDPDTNPQLLWNKLNEIQAKLYLANGRVVDSAQQKIIDVMDKLSSDGGMTFHQPTVNNIYIQANDARDVARRVQALTISDFKHSRKSQAAT